MNQNFWVSFIVTRREVEEKLEESFAMIKLNK